MLHLETSAGYAYVLVGLFGVSVDTPEDFFLPPLALVAKMAVFTFGKL